MPLPTSSEVPVVKLHVFEIAMPSTEPSNLTVYFVFAKNGALAIRCAVLDPTNLFASLLDVIKDDANGVILPAAVTVKVFTTRVVPNAL